jgi:hypothetical protein
MINFTWGKWQGEVITRDQVAVLHIYEKGSTGEISMSHSIPIKDIPNMFPSNSENEDEPLSIQKWIDHWTPFLIEQGIKKGFWAA